MANSNRRNVVAAMGASLALAGLGTPVQLAAKRPLVAFPERAFTLRRMLRRDLGNGAAIVVTRDWKARFERAGAGATIGATQVDCLVEAPPSLAPLAKIERDREVTGLFPMELDQNGQIVSWAHPQPVGIEAAIDTASKILANSTLDLGQHHDARAYILSVGQTAAEVVSQVPQDLFYPETGSSSQLRELQLPDGMSGTYEITVSAQACEREGLLKQSERRIVTRIEDTTRTALERWSILEKLA